METTKDVKKLTSLKSQLLKAKRELEKAVNMAQPQQEETLMMSKHGQWKIKRAGALSGDYMSVGGGHGS